MTRRRSIRRPRRPGPSCRPARARRNWPAAAGRRRRSARGGTGRRAGARARRPTRTAARARSAARTTSSVAARPARPRTSGRSRGRRRRRCRRTAGARACARPGSSRCAGRVGASCSRDVRPGSTPRVVAPSSSLPSNSSWSPRQMPRNGRSRSTQSRIGSTRPRRARRAIAGAAAPTPGTTIASASRRPLRVARDGDRGADGGQRLLDAHEVARPVVDDRDPRPCVARRSPERRPSSRRPRPAAGPARRPPAARGRGP